MTRLVRMLTGLRKRLSITTQDKASVPAIPPIGAQVSTIPSGGAPPRLGTRELLKAYSEMPWLHAVVSKVSRSVGETNWKLFIDRSSSNGETVRNHKLQRLSFVPRQKLIEQKQLNGNLEEVESHPILDMLHHANSALFGVASLQVTQSHIDLAGEAFWLIERSISGMPLSYWPLPPDWVKHLPTESRPTYIISQPGGNDTQVPTSEMIHFRDPDPSNPYQRGIGNAKALGDELETDEYAAKHLKQFFYNRARPDLIISGDNLSLQDTTRLEEKWLNKHQGFWKSWKPHFFSRKIDVKEVGQSFENMQMIELRKFERDMIIQVFGFPPEKFGIVNESKRATISAADFFWTKDIIQPRVELIRDVLQGCLVPLFDEKLILDFESPIVQDQEHELAVMKSASWSFTQNEWRIKAGLADIGEDGEVSLIPVNMVPRKAGEDIEMPKASGGGDNDEKPPGEEDPPAAPDSENPPDMEESLEDTVTRGVMGQMPLIEQKIRDNLYRRAS